MQWPKSFNARYVLFSKITFDYACNQLCCNDRFLQKAKPLYVYRKKSDQTNMVEVAKDFIGDNYSRSRGRSNLYYCNGIIKS